jgi:hypothetical protein
MLTSASLHTPCQRLPSRASEPAAKPDAMRQGTVSGNGLGMTTTTRAFLFAIVISSAALVAAAKAQNPPPLPNHSTPKSQPSTQGLIVTHRNWHGIDEASVFQPFNASDYDTIAVESFDINGVRLPPAKENTIHAVEQALNDMKPEFIAGLTKKAQRSVSAQQTGRTLVVRARIGKLDPGSQGGRLFESGTVQIQIIGELIDGSSGQVLVRFAQERQSGFRVFGGGHGELFRQTARQLGEDVANLINGFSR